MSEATRQTKISRDEKLKKIDETILNNFLEEDKIKSFSVFQDLLKEKVIGNSFNICLKHCSNVTYILFLDFENMPSVIKSILIYDDFSIKVFISNTAIDIKNFQNVLDESKVSRWSQMQNIFNIVQSESAAELKQPSFKLAISYWKSYIEEDENSENETKKKFLLQQMILCEKPKMARRYTSSIYHFACSLFLKSSSCYKALYDSNTLTLPSPSNLSKILCFLKPDISINSTTNIEYMKAKCERLSENDRLVNLMIDEIYVKKRVSFKGGCVTGFSDNRLNEEATTIQSFMISSLFSKYKEMVALVPVCRMTADDLYKLTVQVLKMLYESGFRICALISDNNRVNRNMFGKMCNGSVTSYVKNPANENEHVYLLFDSVHLLKSIRNNWLNQMDCEKTFRCPTFDDHKSLMCPQFSHLRKMYHLERSQIIKYAHQLTGKSMYPSNLEKQNVLLAVKVFHESNVAALKRLAATNSTFFKWEDTAEFLKLIKRWWDMVNVSHPKKGLFSNNNDAQPFSSLDDERLHFMNQFIVWLNAWKNLNQPSRQGCLSEETCFALTHTTATLSVIIKHLLQSGMKYVLTSKFQTDPLEFRFSMYRQMSGSNYHVSVEQILESERKLRIKSLLHLHSTKFGAIPLKDFVLDICSVADSDASENDLDVFDDILNTLDLSTISQCDTEILIYIAGYCAHKLKLQCDKCTEFFVDKSDLNVETDESSGSNDTINTAYLNLINRGKLKIPKVNVIYTVSVCYKIFQDLLSCYENLYLKNHKQHSVLCGLTEKYLLENDVFDVDEFCSNCNYKYFIGIKKIILSFSNICLNNFTKVIAEKSKVLCDERKLKKFKKC